MERRFLRFVGKLWETGEFEPGIGWETERVARRPRAEDGLTLQLLSGDGDVLVEAGVEVRTPLCRSGERREMRGQRLVSYLPLHADGRTVVLLRDGRAVHRVDLPQAAPRIRITSHDVDKTGRVHLRWDATHDRTLWFDVVFTDGEHRSVSVARELTEHEATVDTANLPGGLGCSVTVLATDGLRSSLARSAPFDLPEQPPRLTISMPKDGDVVAAGQPISLLGHSHEVGGRALSDDHLVWLIDGAPVARGRRMAPAGPLAPGAHRVELAFAPNGETVARIGVTLRVAGHTPEYEAWRAISASLTRNETSAIPPSEPTAPASYRSETAPRP
ncbi:MAG: hypothetical protein ABJD07_07805 [Gemmatimonadaceae bacterium]